MPLEFAKGEPSFNPQPTARNLNKPARVLRMGSKGEGGGLPNPVADAQRQRSAALRA